MRNKRASVFLPESVLKTVIAVIVLGLLFLGAIKVYSTFLGDYKERQAKEILNEIERSIRYLEENPGEENTSVLLSRPDEWYFVLNKQEDLICICPDSNFEKCNLRNLCYFSGYILRTSNTGSVKIESVEKKEKSFFKTLVISLETKNKELNFLVKIGEETEEIN